jgi:hypothetical protein
VTRDESHVSVGGLLAPGRSGKKDDRGERKRAETEVTAGGRTTRAHARKRAQGKRQLEEEQHTCMGGRPNVGRVRVLVIHCKWLKSPIDINIDT